MSEKEKNNNGINDLLKEMKLQGNFEGMLFTSIMSLDYDELDEMIINKEMPQILQLIEFGEKTNLALFHNIKRIIYNKRDTIVELLTVDNLIEYGVLYGRPDLAKRISMNDGRRWMKSVIVYLTIIIKNMNLNSTQIRMKIAEHVKKSRRKRSEKQKELIRKKQIEEELRLEEERMKEELKAAAESTKKVEEKIEDKNLIGSIELKGLEELEDNDTDDMHGE